eukprot:s2359_g7.t1
MVPLPSRSEQKHIVAGLTPALSWMQNRICRGRCSLRCASVALVDYGHGHKQPPHLAQFIMAWTEPSNGSAQAGQNLSSSVDVPMHVQTQNVEKVADPVTASTMTISSGLAFPGSEHGHAAPESHAASQHLPRMLGERIDSDQQRRLRLRTFRI